MWRLGYKTGRKKDANKLFWEYTYVSGDLDDVFKRITELRDILGITKFSIELREEER